MLPAAFRKGKFMDFKSALLSATAVLLVTAPARADVSPDVQKTLNDTYQLTCAAVLDPTDPNMDAAFAAMSPDFVNVDLKGKQEKRDDVIGMVKQQLKLFHGTSCNIAIDDLTQPDPNTVVLTSTLKVEGDFQGQDGKHEVQQTGKSQDTWKLNGGKWMETQSKELKQLVKVDGNVVQDAGQ